MTGYTTYTALYDTREDAERVQAELQRLGIVDADGHSLYGGEAHSEGGFWADHKGAAPPEADRRLYEEGVKRGGYLLTVNVDAEQAERVHQLLEGSNAVDVDAREAEYRKEGLLPSAGAIPAATGAVAAGADQVIPIIEEQLKVGKRQVERGGVRVRSYVVETPVTEQVQLRQERVEVERRPVNQPLTGTAAEAFQARDIALTERSEEAVVAKDARVVEEVSLQKDVTQRTEEVSDTVRRTEVEIERLADGGSTRRT